MALSLDARREQPGREIAAAEAELAAREDLEWAGVGPLLAALNADLADVGHDDAALAHGRYDDLENRVTEARAKMGPAR